MAFESLPWKEMLASSGLTGAIIKGADLFFGRKTRAERALSEAVDHLSDQLEKADLRMDGFNARLDECHRQHQDCERGREDDRRQHRKEINALKAQISSLMDGPVASYSAADLRRMGKKS